MTSKLFHPASLVALLITSTSISACRSSEDSTSSNPFTSLIAAPTESSDGPRVVAGVTQSSSDDDENANESQNSVVSESDSIAACENEVDTDVTLSALSITSLEND